MSKVKERTDDGWEERSYYPDGRKQKALVKMFASGVSNWHEKHTLSESMHQAS